MKESHARIEIAKSQNEIFKRIFNNISNDEFNTNLNLANINSNCLRDYWTYIIGFLMLQNFENFGINFSNEDLQNILEGNFKLKYLTDEEAENLKQISKRPSKIKGAKEKTKLYTIQDGTYTLITNKAAKNKNQRHQLILDTDSPKYFTNDPNLDMSPANFIKILRNLFAHTSPYINGANIVLLNKDDIVEVPKMWLRGYSELFSQTQQHYDINYISKLLTNELIKSGNNLENSKDIDEALSFLKTILFTNMPENNFRMNNFIKTRLNLVSNFKNLPLEEKISTITQLLAHNPNYIKSNAETINPTIIYNLEQLVSNELLSRGEFLDITMVDIDYNALAQLDNEIRTSKANLDAYEKQHYPYRSPAEKVQINRMVQKYNDLIKEYKQTINELTRKTTIESSLMHLYNADTLKHLPAEVAVNTVCLMGFNALVTSAYYDDLIFKTNPHNLTENQQKYFNNISLNSISYTHNGTKYRLPYDSYAKFFILKELRNSICHGLITYQLPNSKTTSKPSFKDIEITFYVDYENAEVSGKLIDFYNLFSNEKVFFRKRPENIITGPQRELTDKGEPIFDDNQSSQNNHQPQ